ncbi:hypothetical protein ACFWNC_13840 [Streptomyces sp. NPDC058369]|uniref:hypothetical protein n=1 Tax=Streptomyces sp. NPDC058369 TaxID=3346462 RepID=UPI00365E3B2A
MKSRSRCPLTAAAWLALTAAGVTTGCLVQPAWGKVLCLVAASATLRLALHTLWPRRNAGAATDSDRR